MGLHPVTRTGTREEMQVWWRGGGEAQSGEILSEEKKGIGDNRLVTDGVISDESRMRFSPDLNR